LKIHDGGSCHFEKPLNRDILETVKPISTKFGTLMRMCTPERSVPLKYTFKNLRY